MALGLSAAGTASTSYALMLSLSPDRSSPVALDGTEVTGNIYVFTEDTSTGVKRVSFWLDDPSRSGSPRKVENGWPHDFNGTAGNKGAIAFDTRTIADGTHTITAAILLLDGTTTVISSAFTANNGVAPPPPPDPPPPTDYRLSVSLSANRASPVALDGVEASGNIYVFTEDTSVGVTQVRFWLDDPTMSGSPRKSESGWPHDFNGTASDKTAIPFDTTSIFDGSHVITAAITKTDGSTTAVSAAFTVKNTTTPPEPTEPGPPDQVHLAWTGDPSTTLTVVWHTKSASASSLVEYRPAGTTAWSTATGAPRPSGTSGTLHEATLTGLSQATAYEYRVSGDDATHWSAIFTTRTAPAAGPAAFDAVYLADTGIAGRLDGLTTGTAQVLDEVAKLNPLVVLPGGDYAYFDTDRRFSTLDGAIDAWFNQMQPIAARSPMMPAYGNHEVKGVENYGSWAARFATPAGFDARRYYSFDVGEVHFVSIYAVDDGSALPSGAVDWIRQDILAAKAAGQRWIIPYFHVSPFADGQNHPSNLFLRAQLGPLFEELGVKLAISSHDQAYERTYPLTDIGGSDTPTSTSFTCYGPDDGVVFAKVSPAGKLSNKNLNFSQFATNPAPHWTAVRNNTMHTFARLRVSDAGTVRFEAYGVVGDGSPPIVLDSFELDADGCPPALSFDPPSLAFTAAPDSAATATATLTTTNGAPAQATVSDDATWLDVSPASAATPGTFTIDVDTTGLAAGSYTATVTAAAPGYEASQLPISLKVVDNTYRLLVSFAANRSSPVRLDGVTASGSIYVFTGPDIDVVRVRFWIDNPTMSGTPYRTENSAPFDLAGTKSSTIANPFDTRTRSNGTHSVTAALDLVTGEIVVVSATFTIAN